MGPASQPFTGFQIDPLFPSRPLLLKAQRRQLYWIALWANLFRYYLALHGVPAGWLTR